MMRTVDHPEEGPVCKWELLATPIARIGGGVMSPDELFRWIFVAILAGFLPFGL